MCSGLGQVMSRNEEEKSKFMILSGKETREDGIAAKDSGSKNTQMLKITLKLRYMRRNYRSNCMA